MFEGFIHPTLAFGALLAGVPLLIHLLNRQRHRPLEWAAMRFVLAAYRRTRRRAQLENLLLLLLRMAAVALLAFAVARPFIGRDSPLAPLTESRRDVVLVLDGSASTGYRENVRTVFEGITERARSILSELDGTRGDRVRLILASGAPHLLSARSPEDALSLLATLSQPTNEPLDLASTLGEVARLAQEESAGSGESNLEVRLLTDLQRCSFFPDVSELEPGEDGARPTSKGLLSALDKLHGLGVRVIVEDHGPGDLDPLNVAIESISPLGPVLGAGAPVEIGVTIASFGSGGAGSVRLALEIDGERRPSRQVDLPGRGRTEAVLPVVFPDGGHHTVTAVLEGDRLPIDDQRSRVVFAPPPLRVLLVDGDPDPRIDRDEVGYLRAVLDPPDEGWIGSGFGSRVQAPFDTRVVKEFEFAGGEIDLAEFDVIVLANALPPSQRTMEALEARVAAGAALLFTAGDNVANEFRNYNARLWRADGSGLLPAELGGRIEVADRRSSFFRAASFEKDHPALAFFADERWKPLLTEVPIYAFLACTPARDASTLIRLDDEGRHPLLVERPYDRGRVLLWNTTIDPAWTRLPESPATLIPLVHELLRYGGRGPVPARNVPVGAALLAEVDTFPRALAVVRPDGSRRTLDGEPIQVGEGIWSLPAVMPTDQIGVWTIERADDSDLVFAVQLDPAESDLLRVGTVELEALHPALRLLGPGDGGDTAGVKEDPRRGELWRWLAALCLAAMVLESLWAAWIGHRRRKV